MTLVKNATFISLAILLIGLVYTLLAYGSLPQTIASHWNSAGVADGYSDRVMVFMPFAVAFGILLLFELLPRIDPLKDRYREFSSEYGLLKVLLVSFITYLGTLMVVFQTYQFNVTQAILPGLAALFFGMGILFSKAKRNWFIGIRTPWTLASDQVWDVTHARGSVLFKVLGLLVLALTVVPSIALPALAVLIFGTVVYLLFYSYAEWKKTSD